MSKIKKNIGKSMMFWISQFLIGYWILFVISDFIITSPDYVTAITLFKYTDFLLTYTLTGIVLFYLLSKRPLHFRSLHLIGIRPVYGYLFLLLTMTILMVFLLGKSGEDGSISGFLGKTILTHLSIFIILSSAYAGGAFILSQINLRLNSALHTIVSLALGSVFLIVGLFIIAVFKILNPVSIAIWLFLFFLPGWRFLLDLYKNIIGKRDSDVILKPYSLLLLLAGNLLIAINLIAITTPIPLGHDSLSLYMNIPKLMSEYGSLVKGYQPHYWSILVSIGYSLFNSNIIAQYLGILPGILSIYIIYHLAKLFVNRDLAIFSAVGFYAIPVILWQSSYEVKTDLGMLFYFLTASLLIFSFCKSEKTTVLKTVKKFLPDNSLKIWALAGVFIGFALGVKLTALIAVYSILIIICYWYGGKLLSMGSFFLCLSTVFLGKLYTFSNFEFTSQERWVLFSGLLGISVILILAGLVRNKENLLTPLKVVVIFAGFATLPVLPWAIKNSLEHGKLSFSTMITGKDAKPRLFGEKSTYEQHHFSPVLMNYTTQQNPDGDQPTAILVQQTNSITGKKEEINRYLGYENGFLRFLSLPYDLTMKKNVPLFAADPGLLFLGLLPLLFLGAWRASLLFFSLRVGFLLIWLSFSITTVYNPDHLLNNTEVLTAIKNIEGRPTEGFWGLLSGIHMVLIIPLVYLSNILSPVYKMLAINSEAISICYIVLFSVILFFLSRPLLSKEDKLSKSFFLFAGVYFFLWLILSSGIPWYGIGGLSLLPLFIAKYIFSGKEDTSGSVGVSYYLCGGLILLWFILLIPFKLTPLAGIKTVEPEKLDYNKVFVGSSLRYACNQISWQESVKDYLNPATREMIRILNNDKDAAILNIGSMMRFFISQNDIRLIDDNQLDFFHTIWKASNKSKIATGNRLKQLKVRYILLDLGVHTMDTTKDGSLIRKVEELIAYIHQNQNIELLATDRLVIHPLGDRQIEINGSMVKVKNDIFGNGIIESGKLALFQIK